MKILVINAGSSSMKYQLLDMERRAVLARGLCERIGIDGRVKHTPEGADSLVEDVPLPDHYAAIAAVIERLTSPTCGVIESLSEITAVGHRAVHGGEDFAASALIDDEVLKIMEDNVKLAPLHTPPILVGIHACKDQMKGVPQVAVFDTAFHQTMPKSAYLYPIPYEYYERLKIRRYGFHGTSHRYVSAQAAEMVGRPISELKIITCHLGNGSSLAAIDGGKSVDTSMGMTPLEGLPMGTRSGSIDPAIHQFIAHAENLDIDGVTDILNKKSGMLGISGISSDFRDLDREADAGNERARLALDIFMRSVKKKIGQFAAILGGVDLLVFTGGIGENNIRIRRGVCEGLSFMGLTLDEAKNDLPGVVGEISVPGSRGKILVVPTNEELVIAMDTEAIVKSKC